MACLAIVTLLRYLSNAGWQAVDRHFLSDSNNHGAQNELNFFAERQNLISLAVIFSSTALFVISILESVAFFSVVEAERLRNFG